MSSSDLTLNCLIWGQYSWDVSQIQISSTKSVSELKSAIKAIYPNKLGAIDAGDITVSDVNATAIPDDDDAHTNMMFERAIIPYLLRQRSGRQQLSKVFGTRLDDKNLHVVVNAPLATLPLVELSFIVHSDSETISSNNIFVITIDRRKRVSDLVDIIMQKAVSRGLVVSANPKLWRVSIPIDGLEEKTEFDKEVLKPTERISVCFPIMPSEHHLQIIVEAPQAAVPRKRALPESENALDRLKRSKYVKNPPSMTAKPEFYEPIQMREPSEKILDDRPEPDHDIPSVALLYEGFGHFLDIMDGRDDVPGLVDIDVMRLHSEVDAFASKMNKYYDNEDGRREACLPCLNHIFSARRGIQIPMILAAAIGSVRSDGHNTAAHGAGTIVVEFKNRITGVVADPQVELACYIMRLNATKMDRQLYERWRIPCVGLTIVGSELKFYAIVAVDHRLKLTSLTTRVSCNESASDGRDRRLLYLAFTAASVLQAHILQDIERLQNNHNTSQPIPNDARRFPAVSKLRQYPRTSDDYFNFKIQAFFPDRQPSRFLYVAETPDNQLVLIKFTRRYSIELHHLCEDLGHAPRILAFERLPGGWYAVAMELIETGEPIIGSTLLVAHRDRWTEELLNLMANFHSKGFVHGDLRDANILCKEESLMLLDFDWGGKDGEVFYPTANLNTELLEGRLSNDLRITKEDDRRVLNRTLAKLRDIHV